MNEATLPMDPNLKLPAAVVAAAAKSDELYNTYRDFPDPNSQVTSEVTPEDAEPNPELDPASLAAPAADPVPEVPPQAEPASDASDSGAGLTLEELQHRYKSVNGRYKGAQAEIRELRETVSNLQSVIATMNAAAPVQASEIPELEALDVVLTPEEVADYGEDFMKVISKGARKEIASIIRPILERNSQLEQKVNSLVGVQQQSLTERLHAKLDERLPNWREINTDQRFLDWLALPDTYSGVKRHDMLKAAYTQGDASRVAAFFNGFLAEEAAVAPAQAQPGISVTTVPKTPLVNLAAPGRAKTAASTPAPAEKPIFTRAQIAEFYAAASSGKFRGREADKNRIEAQIFEAQREGRIRN